MARLSEEVQRLVDEAAEYVRPWEDEAAAEEIARAKRGRPRMSDEATEQLVVRVPSSLRDKLNKRAKDQHVTVSGVTREALERHLAA
ncbi:MAG: CopG family transcriptional regulator [Acidimicrobiales bacterium]|nr:MAG: CopG family transcriptional regulator [Acidimicrobiales bacterium]